MKAIRDYFNLKTDQADRKIIEERIQSNSIVTGSNMYILICAILIASIGLNMDSTAVVIGAMLISPLMSSITNISYGILIQDTKWIRLAISKFLFQIGISIITSTVYFFLSPLNYFSSELLARTQPTLWDALIAVFGGFAAIVASTRKNTFSNVIPGAAIATALMPPLCTVGYCLANGKWVPALGAMYLFSINAAFICISGYIGLRVMHITSAESALSKRKQGFLAAILILALLPSGWIAFESVRQISVEDHFHEFVDNEFQFQNAQVVKSEILPAEKSINIALIGSIVPEDSILELQNALPQYKLGEYTLHVSQTQVEQGIRKEDLDEIISNYQTDINGQKSLQDIQNQAKKKQVDTANELMLLFPQVKKAGFLDIYNQDSNPEFSLLIVTEKTIDEETVSHIKKWAESKINGKVEIIQVQL